MGYVSFREGSSFGSSCLTIAESLRFLQMAYGVPELDRSSPPKQWVLGWREGNWNGLTIFTAFEGFNLLQQNWKFTSSNFSQIACWLPPSAWSKNVLYWQWSRHRSRLVSPCPRGTCQADGPGSHHKEKSMPRLESMPSKIISGK